MRGGGGGENEREGKARREGKGGTGIVRGRKNEMGQFKKLPLPYRLPLHCRSFGRFSDYAVLVEWSCLSNHCCCEFFYGFQKSWLHRRC